MTELMPFSDQVQAIYDHDHTTDLLELFLDPTMLYSCAYFERDDMTLEEAQWAKIDLALGKCDLQSGQTLLEIGCGWGACARRAVEKHGVNVIALTLSPSQQAYCRDLWQRTLGDDAAKIDVRLQGWEQFNEPVDRIVSIAAFEHFRKERYDAFFQRCHDLLTPGAQMLLHTITLYHYKNLKAKGIPLTHENVLFAKMISKEIFPGGELVDPELIIEHAEAAGFEVLRAHSLQSHYARTLDIWAQNLEKNHDEAVRLRSQEVYDRFMEYLVGCANHFRSGHLDLFQFTLKR